MTTKFQIGDVINTRAIGTCTVIDRTNDTVQIANRDEIHDCKVHHDNRGCEFVAVPFKDSNEINTALLISSRNTNK